MFGYVRSGWSGSPAPGAALAQVDLLALEETTSEEESSADQRINTEQVASEKTEANPQKETEIKETDSIETKLAKAHVLPKKHDRKPSPSGTNVEVRRESEINVPSMAGKSKEEEKALASPAGAMKPTTAAKRRG